MRFCDKLKQLRAQKGISQAELAKEIFVSRSAVAKWENGLGLPGEQSLSMLADYFGIEISELLSDTTTETVIVTKNSTINKQKIWIIAISVLAVIAITVLVSLSFYFVSRPAKPAEPIITRQLIFETEKELKTEEIVNYPDGEISADNTFADSRTFEIGHSVGSIRLPEILVKVTVNGEVSYESVDYSNLVVACSENILLRGDYQSSDANTLLVLPKDYYEEEFIGWANIKYGDLCISIKLFRNHIAVESVTVRFSDDSDEIGLTQSKTLLNNILPYNASYKDYVYVINKIIRPDGGQYSDDLSEYAYIENHNLTATKNIELGSVIYLYAVTDYDNVKSNLFVVTVKRIEIESIRLSAPVFSTGMEVGESNTLTLNCYPDNATFNVLEEQATVTLLTPEFATLEKAESGWILTASADMAAVGKEICVKVETPEGAIKTFSWEIYGIPVESLVLINADTGEELDEVTYIDRNGTLRLTAVVTPENATYEKISYNIFVNLPNFGRYVKITDDGVLTVSDKAPYNMEIFISATAVHASSKSYKVVVDQAIVESVTIACETDVIHINKITSFTIEYTPSYADIDSIEYNIIEEVEGVCISSTMLFASSNAVVGTQFHVQVIINGVESNILTFTIAEKESESL